MSRSSRQMPAVRNCDRCDEYPQRRRCRKTADDVGNDLLRGKRIKRKGCQAGVDDNCQKHAAYTVSNLGRALGRGTSRTFLGCFHG